MADEIEQRFDIEIAANGEGAEQAFTTLDDSAKSTAETIERANERIVRSAEQAKAGLNQQAAAVTAAAKEAGAAAEHAAAGSAQTITRVAGEAARATAEMRKRFADDSRLLSEDTARFGASEIQTAAERAKELLKQTQRELAAIRDDARAGVITPQETIASTRALRDAATLRPNAPAYTRAQLQEGSLGGDPERMSRYRAYVEADRQMQAADNELTESVRRNAQEQQDAIASLAQQRANAYREQLRTGQITLEEERTQLQSALRDYEQYAQARNEIDKRLTDNSIKLAAQRNRETGKQKGEVAGSLLNVGYILPGAVGNAVTNLGYGLQGGPAEAAALVGATAAVGIGGLLAGAATVAAKDQEAMERLGVAVKAQGADWNALSKQVADWTELQERTTTFGRSQTVPALNELAVAGVKLSDAFKIVRVAEDASAATGKPLAEVTHQLLEAYNGNSRGLIQLGVVTRDQIKDGMSLMQIFVAIEKAMANQATTTGSYGKQIIILGNNAEELARLLGVSLLPPLTEVTHKINDILTRDTTKNAFVRLGEDVTKFIDVLDKMNTALGPFDKFMHFALEHGGKSLLGGAADDPYGLASANRGVGGGAAAPLPGDRGAGGYGSLITADALRFGVDPRLASAMFGAESAYDPKAVSNKGAQGLGQLMPGTAKEMGVTNPFDPVQNIRGSMQYLADQLKTFNGNRALALAAYNAGPQAVKDVGGDISRLPRETQKYVREILAASGDVGPTMASAREHGLGTTNRADVNVVGRQNRSGLPQYQVDLAKAEATAQQERLAGVADWRQREEQAIQAILQADTLSAKQRAQLEKQLAGLQIADQKDVEKAAKAAATARERELRAEIGRADTQRVRSTRPGEDVQQRQAAYEREIHELERIRDLRAQSSDANASKDVDALNAKIARLTNASAGLWTRALDEARKHYKASSESLDEFLAKLEKLKRGTSTDQKRHVEEIKATEIDAAAKALVKDLTESITVAFENGAPRPTVEEMQRAAIKTIGQVSNYGSANVSDLFDKTTAGLRSSLNSEYHADSTDQVRDLDRQYKELATDVSDAATARSRFVSVDANSGDAAVRQAEERVRVEREQIALIEQHIRALQQLAAQYQHTYGAQAKDAVDAINRTVEGLQTTEHDQIDNAQRDERAALEARADEYRQFARSASDSLASIWSSGENGIRDFAKIFKSVFLDLEQSALKSGFAALLGQPGAAGGVSFTNSLSKSLFGSVAPAGFSGGGGASPVSAASAAVGIGGASPPASADFFSLFSDPRVTQQVASNASQSGLVGAIIGTSGAQQVAAALPASVVNSPASSGGVSADAILLKPIGTTGANGSGNVVYGDPSQQGGSGGGGFGGFNPFKGGAKAGFNNFLGGFGVGEAAVGISGGNQLYGGIGSALGAGLGSAFGGPVGGPR